MFKWRGWSMNTDAFVIYSLDEQDPSCGRVMKAIFASMRFSFDFQYIGFLWKK